MLSVSACAIPVNSLLLNYAADDAGYTDCYWIQIEASISQADYVAAFYTTWLFKLERLILTILVSKPSTDDHARQLADGVIEVFSAWRVETRSERELLLCDYRGRTRSWLMASEIEFDGEPKTILYFGSAVVPVMDRKTGRRRLGSMFFLVLGFHKLYSRALLYSAKVRLDAQHK